MTNNNKKNNPWANLVIAMLSLNSYPIERTWTLFDKLGANGLFNPQNIASWSYDELCQRLISSGYDRGRMNDIFAERLWSIRNLADNVSGYEKIIANGTEDDVTKVLSKIKGVGPVVIKNYLLLRG